MKRVTVIHGNRAKCEKFNGGSVAELGYSVSMIPFQI